MAVASDAGESGLATRVSVSLASANRSSTLGTELARLRAQVAMVELACETDFGRSSSSCLRSIGAWARGRERGAGSVGGHIEMIQYSRMYIAAWAGRGGARRGGSVHTEHCD